MSFSSDISRPQGSAAPIFSAIITNDMQSFSTHKHTPHLCVVLTHCDRHLPIAVVWSVVHVGKLTFCYCSSGTQQKEGGRRQRALSGHGPLVTMAMASGQLQLLIDMLLRSAEISISHTTSDSICVYVCASTLGNPPQSAAGTPLTLTF